jgi:hypothetical protein
LEADSCIHLLCPWPVIPFLQRQLVLLLPSTRIEVEWFEERAVIRHVTRHGFAKVGTVVVMTWRRGVSGMRRNVGLGILRV